MKTPANPWQVPAPPIAPLAFKIPPGPDAPAAPAPEPPPLVPALAALAGTSPELAASLEKANAAQAAVASGSQRAPDKGAARLLALSRGEGVQIVRDRATARTLAVVQVGSRREVYDGDSLQGWLSALAVERGIVSSGGALADAARAQLSLPAVDAPVHVGLGASDDGSRFYLDLGDDSGAAGEVDALGYRVVASPPVLFARSAATRPLPHPVDGGALAELGSLLSLAGETLILLISWLLGALNPRGPYPILCLSGEAGSGKSTLTRALVSLLAPQAAALRSLPTDDRALAIFAENSRVLAFDNCSTVRPDLADALCRLADGGGLATRELYSDRKLAIFDAMRPIILNGIPSLLDRSDLGDRAILLELPARRGFRAARDLAREFDAARPRLLGALLTAASAALANQGNPTPGAATVRMYDFAAWVLAAANAGALPFTGPQFLAAYGENRRAVALSAVEADVLAAHLFAMVPNAGDCIEAPASELLARLAHAASLDALPARARADWPASPTALGKRLSRLASAARLQGVQITKGRSASRSWRVEREAEPEPEVALAPENTKGNSE